MINQSRSLSTLGGKEATIILSGVASIGGCSVRGHCGERSGL